MILRLLRTAIVSLVFLPGTVGAAGLPNRSIVVATGIRVTFIQALQNLTTLLAVSMVGIATVIFLIGAMYMVGSLGRAEMVEKGKKLMQYSLIGMAIVLGSYTILRTVLYLLYI